MSLIKNIKLDSSRKAAPDQTFGGNWVPVGGDSSGVQERNLLLNNKEWVAVAVDTIAAAVSSVRFKVMRYQKNGDDQEVFDGPLVDFLEKPAINLTGKDFLYLNTTYKELTGNAFWEKDGKFLTPLIPTSVSPVIEGGKLIGYRYTAGGTERVIAYKNVLHDRYIDPARPYWGRGKLSKIARWVDTSSYSNEFLRRFFLNGATFGGFIETDDDSEERINIIKAGLKNDHVGVENAHKIGVLPKNSKFSKVTSNMSEIEMGETDDRYRDKILAGFGVPKTLVGLTTEVNRASAEAAEYVFARYTVKPIVDDLIEFLNVNVVPMISTDDRLYYAYEDFIPANEEIKLKEREIALNRQPYRTVNEVRAEAGLPPVPGGDVVYGNPLLAPLGTPAASPDMPAGDDEDEEDEENAKPAAKARQKALPARVRAAAKREDQLDRLVSTMAKAVAKKVEEAVVVKDLDAEAHVKFVGRVEAYAARMEQTVKDFNNRQQRQVLLDLASITKNFSDKAVAKTDLWDMTGEVELMVDVVTPLLAGLLTEQAIREYEAQGFAGTFDSGSDLVRETVRLAARRLSKSYNNTTANLLKKALNDGIVAGDSLAQLTKRVNEVYEYSDMVRAKAVAHTESFYIANKGSKIAYQQSGVVKTIRWYTAEDERVCEFCGPMHKRTIPVDGTFFKKGDTFSVITAEGIPKTLKLDYRRMDVPPLHVNCRCQVFPEEISID